MAPLASSAQQMPQCRLPAALARLPGLSEASGVAASRTTPGRFWTHNDSSEPVLFALDTRGSITGQLRLLGATVEDWEAVAVGPCESGSCIYVADIGDNNGGRDRITVYRVAEPRDLTGPVQVDAFHATYPDGARDAESLLVTTDGRLYIVSKGNKAPVSLYRFPNALRAGTTVRLERVGEPRDPQAPAANDRITDGAVSPDNRWVVLRGARTLTFYRTADLLAGHWREAGRIPLASLKEPQGEGVTFGADGSVYLVGEGGGRGRPGTFAQLACTPRP
jgi:hypothetical protein